ncbi:MAG: fibronectin type III domain-containing protein [Bdellovibrionales bacterium]|nr:fibronectin type III domain-containing protein [Bdellovibrionales bacterium]
MNFLWKLAVVAAALALPGCLGGEQGGNCKEDPATGEKKCEPSLPSSSAPLPSPKDQVCTVDRYKQNGPTDAVKKLDVLFVQDTSGSMQDDWERVAQNIQSFIAEVPADVDVSYGVILGHVGDLTGKLYAGHKQPLVLNNQTMTVKDIQQSLHRTFVDAMKTSDAASGEALFHGLYRAVTKGASASQKAGFFRADAALAVVFVSDEQEIGFPFPNPQAPGLPPRCDAAYEDDLRGNWYVDKGIDLEVTYQAVKRLKGDMPLSMHAIVNITADDLFRRNPKEAKCLYDSLGYGYFDMVKKAGGVLFSIQEDTAQALQKIGRHTSQTLNYVLDFRLGWPAANVDPASILAKVNGGVTAHVYDAAANVVRVDGAAIPYADIEISYCSPKAVNEWQIIGFQGTAFLDQVALTWQTPSARTTSRVYWGTSATDLSQSVDQAGWGTEHNHTVTGLSADTTYFFRLSTKDELGRTQLSGVVEVRTLAPVPEWQVLGFQGTASDTSVTLTFNTGTEVTTASVAWGTDAGSLANSVATAGAAASHSALVSGLAPDTVYYFRARAVDAHGNAKESAVLQVRTLEKVVVPPQWQILGLQGVSDETSVTLNWSTGTEMTFTTIAWGLSAGNLSWATQTGTATSHSLTFPNLTPDTAYFFRVTAHDGQGNEQTSDVIEVRTKAVVVPPADWQVMGFDGTTTPSSATMIWQTPGVSTRAVLRVGLSADNLTRSIDVPGYATSQIVTVDGLAAGTVYYFQVDTYDATGKLVQSSVISKKTKTQ